MLHRELLIKATAKTFEITERKAGKKDKMICAMRSLLMHGKMQVLHMGLRRTARPWAGPVYALSLFSLDGPSGRKPNPKAPIP